MPDEDKHIAAPSLWRKLSCHLGLHRWGVQSTEDGHRWTACTACGKDQRPPPHWSGAGG